jgi:hypothetical protein
MHCYADLPAGGVAEPGGDDGDGEPTRAEPAADPGGASDGGTTASDDGVEGGRTPADHGLLDPEGTADNVLTVVAAILGSIVIGFVGFFELLLATGSAWAIPVGFFTWLGGLAYLARQYSVQETVAKTFYGAAVVLLLLPFVALNPGMEGGIGDRVLLFVSLLLFAAIPACLMAAIGYGVSYFAPERR